MGPRPAGSPESRQLARPDQAHRAARALPGGAGRPAQRDRDGARPRAGLHRGRRALRHEGHPRLRGRERRRLRDGRRRFSSHARSGARGTRSSSSSSTARRRRAEVPDTEFERYGLRGSKVAAPRLPRCARDDPARLRGRQEARDQARGLLGRAPLDAAARGGDAGGRRGRVPRPRHRAACSTTTSRSWRRACARST